MPGIGRTPDPRRFLLIPLIVGLVCLLGDSAMVFLWLDYASNHRLGHPGLMRSEFVFAVRPGATSARKSEPMASEL